MAKHERNNVVNVSEQMMIEKGGSEEKVIKRASSHRLQHNAGLCVETKNTRSFTEEKSQLTKPPCCLDLNLPENSRKDTVG